MGVMTWYIIHQENIPIDLTAGETQITGDNFLQSKVYKNRSEKSDGCIC